MWSGSVADTLYGALAAAAPHTATERSLAEWLPIREAIQDAIDALDPTERFIFDACVVERRSLRAIETDTAAQGRRIPRTTAARIRDRAVTKLQLALEGHPLILEYMHT